MPSKPVKESKFQKRQLRFKFYVAFLVALILLLISLDITLYKAANV